MWFLPLFLTTVVFGEEAVCNIQTDNKTNTEGCGTDDNNKNLEDTEYAKLRWTDSEDWDIKEKLDFVDELIVSEPEKAVEEFRSILKNHPRSKRANYALARTCQILLWKTVRSQKPERADLCETAQRHLRIVAGSGEGKPALVAATGSLMLSLAQEECGSSREDVVEALLVILREEELLKTRYPLILIQELFLLGRWNQMDEWLAKAGSNSSTHFLLHLLKSTSMKVREEGRDVKAANKLLREVDLEETLEREEEVEKNKVEVKESLMQIVTDLNYLARELARAGNEDTRNILLKDASRLHLISSPKQRPVDFIPDLRSHPIWSMDQLKPANRWSSASSLTGLGLATTHLVKLEKQVEVVAKEAAALAEEVGLENSSWVEEGPMLMVDGRAFQRPLYSWGKRRHAACALAPSTCSLVKQFVESSKCKKCQSKILVLEPKSRQVVRVGPTNGRLRALLPLKVAQDGGARLVAGGEEVVLELGKVTVVDDSFDTALQSGEGEMHLLQVDFYHPDINDRKKKDAYSEKGQNQFALY